MEKIIIKGAREHNLKNIDLELQRNQLIVITGLSGSGKSSLAFDTIYAEGQRRYVESLSTYARQFLEQMPKPDLDSIEGLSPTISIAQKSVGKNPRSTVGTITEIYDYLRLLFSRVGKVNCYSCGRKISAQTLGQMIDITLRLPEGTRFSVIAPVVRNEKGDHKELLASLKKQGYKRVNIDQELVDLEEQTPKLDQNLQHSIEVYIDRLVNRTGIRQRLSEALELALNMSHGVAKISPILLNMENIHPDLELTNDGDLLFSEKFHCPFCDIRYPELSARFFSFNNPLGACPNCNGLGAKMFFDPELVIPDGELSIREGAIEPWEKRNRQFFQQSLESLSIHYKFDLLMPWYKLNDQIKDIILYGSKGVEINFTFEKSGQRQNHKKEFEGVIPNLERRFLDYERRLREDKAGKSSDETSSEYDEFEPYMSYSPCEACQGTRLRKEARAVRVGEKGLSELCSMPLKHLQQFFDGLSLSTKEKEIAGRILKEIQNRLSFLVNVGLDYLTLDRTASTLSGGEAQRIRLATQIGSSLVGVLYILDEPSIGLHQRDNDRLIKTLTHLKEMGNTVIIVEHDEDTIRAADCVVDMGPKAGVLGGRVVALGTPKEVMTSVHSLTGAYLSGRRKIDIPSTRRQSQNRYIVIKGAKAHNLKNVTARFPVGVLTAVTGVSGSGKSTLVIDTLLPILKQKLQNSHSSIGAYDEIEGIYHFDRVIDIDQSPIGRTPRSNPATYTGLFAHIRDLFAELPDSKARGYKAGRYSFNIKGGRCESCQGDGVLRIEMHFLPDVYVTCESCRGLRYNRETLDVLYKGASIADVLDMTISQAYDFLGHIPKIKQKLETLKEVGLGYLTLGQSATTLSGGEAQRIKLARELAKKGSSKTVYILDEPTTGLHFEDIKQLLSVLSKLVEQGSTVIVIEHNLDVVKTADHVIDLGPEGGEGGGSIIAAGTPEDIAKVSQSHTGKYLRKILGM